MGIIWIVKCGAHAPCWEELHTRVFARDFQLKNFDTWAHVDASFHRNPSPNGLLFFGNSDAAAVGLNRVAEHRQNLANAAILFVVEQPTATLSSRAYMRGVALVVGPADSFGLREFSLNVQRAKIAWDESGESQALASALEYFARRWQLTPRQLQILTRYVHGHELAEIACALGVATATVKKHVRLLLDRTGNVDLREVLRQVHALGYELARTANSEQRTANS